MSNENARAKDGSTRGGEGDRETGNPDAQRSCPLCGKGDGQTEVFQSVSDSIRRLARDQARSRAETFLNKLRSELERFHCTYLVRPSRVCIDIHTLTRFQLDFLDGEVMPMIRDASTDGKVSIMGMKVLTVIGSNEQVIVMLP